MILTLHVIVCVMLILFVLLQSGKEGMGVIFGGGTGSLFGGSGAGGILVKLTTFLAIVFVATSLGYNLSTSGGVKSQSTILEMQIDDPTKPAVESAPMNSAPASAVASPAENATSPSTAQ